MEVLSDRPRVTNQPMLAKFWETYIIKICWTYVMLVFTAQMQPLSYIKLRSN
jgi:hypothetical protein